MLFFFLFSEGVEGGREREVAHPVGGFDIFCNQE